MSNQASLGDISGSGNSTTAESKEDSTQESYLQLGPDTLDIPEGWGKTEFDDTFSHQRGVNYSGDNYVEEGEGMIFLTLNAIAPGGGLKKDSLKYYEDEISEKRKVKPGDILMANTDLNQEGEIVGYPVKVPNFDSEQEICFSHHLLKIEQEEEKFNEQFLEYLFSSNYIHSRMVAFSCGSTVLNLNTSLLEKLELPVPEKDEQRRIASVLYNVDQAIQKTEEIIEQTQRVKKGLMQDLFTEGHSEHEEFEDSPAGKIPSDWEIVRLGDDNYFKRFSGDTPSKDEEEFWNGDIQWLSNSEVEENRVNIIGDTDLKITEKGLQDCTAKIVPEDSVILSCTASIGKVAINTDEMATNQQFNSFKIKKGFDEYFLANQLVRRSSELEAMGGSTTHNHLPVYVLDKFPLIQPSEEEQKAISEVLRNLDEKIEREKEEKEQLQRLKKGLMQDLLTGSVRTGEDVEVLDEVVEVEG
jgi:type I restriction enzyme S subunit